MSAAAYVHEHDPVALSAPRLGNWIECECGWISEGYITPSGASAAWGRHVARAKAVSS